AEDVGASWDPSMQLGGVIELTATVQAGHAPQELEAALDEEIKRLRDAPPDAAELERAKRNVQAQLYSALENVGGFGGKADQLNYYEMWAQDPGYFSKNLLAFMAVTGGEVQKAAQQFMRDEQRVVITVLPEQKQAQGGEK